MNQNLLLSVMIFDNIYTYVDATDLPFTFLNLK